MALTKCKECGKEVSTKAEACPNCGAKLKRSSRIGCGTIVGGFFLLVVIGAVISSLSTHQDLSSNSSSSAPNPRPSDPKAEALAAVQLKSYNWSKGGFDNIMFLDAVIENKGSRNVKDIEITCTHSAPSGTVIDRNQKVVFETVPAHATKTIRKFSMGFIHSQAAKSGCEITDLVVQ